MAERTIFLKKRPIRKEGIAGGAITPGMTVVLGSDGKFIAGPAAAAAPADRPLLVAFENELTDHHQSTPPYSPIAGSPIDVPYANNDRLFYGALSTGAEFYGLVAAAAVAIVKGDMLEFNSGYLRKATTGTVKAVALEAVDNSGGASPARIICEAV